MAQNLTIAGANYSAVPALHIPKTGGGIAVFPDTSGDTVTAEKLDAGITAHDASGNQIIGTRSGVQTYTGSFTTNYQGNYTVNCGFTPDYVVVPQLRLDVGGGVTVSNYLALPFHETVRTDEIVQATAVITDNTRFSRILSGQKTANGFTGQVLYYDYSLNTHEERNQTYTYTAMKWS